MNEFQRFERLLKDAFVKNAALFNFKNTVKAKASADDLDATQHIIDYCINNIMSLKYDDQIIECLSNHIKFDIAPAFCESVKNSSNTFKYTEEYHDAMFSAKKNILNEKEMIEIDTGDNIIYVQPYVHEVEDIIESKIIKTKFRFVIICIHK